MSRRPPTGPAPSDPGQPNPPGTMPAPPALHSPRSRRTGRGPGRVLAIGLLVVGAATAWAVWELRFGPAASRWNCVIITLDTTRADHLSCYGYPHLETPTVDALARHGVRYARCYSPVPLTLPAHSSLFTGLYPFYHGVRDNGAGALDSRAVTLAELFQARGYRTAAFLGAYVLNERYGLGQGFDLYDADFSANPARSQFHFAERNAAEVTDLALAWLERSADRPFFLWVHYFDAHAPYQPPGYSGPPATATAYDREIAFVDSQLRRLLERLDQLRTSTGRDTCILLAGDHGESLWDHGEPTHGLFVYDDTLHVPLIVCRPGPGPRNAVVNTPVSLVDVFPSVVQWLGLETPAPVHGRILPEQDTAAATAPPDRALYFESHMAFNWYRWAVLEGVVRGQRKYISAPRPEVYDLAADPEELRNLFADHDPAADDLHAELTALLDEPLTFAPLAAGAPEQDPEAVRKLQALGYVGTILTTEPASGPLADPKDRSEVHRRVIQAQSELENGRFELGTALLGQVLDDDPHNPRATYLLLGLLKEPAARSAVVERLVRHAGAQTLTAPFDALVPLYAAIALAEERQFDAAERLARQALAANADSAEAHHHLANILAARRPDDPEVLEHRRRAWELNPDGADLAAALAHAWQQRGEPNEAYKVYEAILSRNPDDVAALNNSAWILRIRGSQAALADTRIRRALVLAPRDAHVRHTAGCLLLDAARPAEAAEHLAVAVEVAPDFAEAWYHLGLARLQQGDRASAAEALDQALAQAPPVEPEWLPEARRRRAALRENPAADSMSRGLP